MKNRITKKGWLRRLVSLLTVFSMIFASGGTAAFADISAGEQIKVWGNEQSVEGHPSEFFFGDITYIGSDFKVIAHIGADAQLPADVELQVEEILPDTEQYRELAGIAEDQLTDDWSQLGLTRFFDIAFVSNGVEIEPAKNAKVDVQILFDNAFEVSENKELQALHFDESGNPSKVEIQEQTNLEEQIDSILFSSDSFSVFGVMEIEQIITKTIKNYSATYRVMVTYGENAGIPAGSTLQVREIKSDSDEYPLYANQTAAALRAPEDATELFGLYDISIITPEGEKIQPNEEVNVSIYLIQEETLGQVEDLKVVHFTDDINQSGLDAELITEESKAVIPTLEVEAEVITPEVQGQSVIFETVPDQNMEPAKQEEEGTEVSFGTDGFSVFAIAYTVDFEYVDEQNETHTWSFPGTGSVKLSDMLKVLGIVDMEEEDATIESASLSDPTLGEDGIYDAHDLYLEQVEDEWYIKSENPFDDTYTLTVILLKNDENATNRKTFTVTVTDGAGDNNHTVIIQVDSGVNLGGLYVVLKQEQASTPQGPADQFYVGEINVSGGTLQASTFKAVYNGVTDNPYDHNTPVTAMVAVNTNGMNQTIDEYTLIYNPDSVTYIDEIKGKAILVSTDNDTQTTTVRIGGTISYTASLSYIDQTGGHSVPGWTGCILQGCDNSGGIYSADLTNSKLIFDYNGDETIPKITSWKLIDNEGREKKQFEA